MGTDDPAISHWVDQRKLSSLENRNFYVRQVFVRKYQSCPIRLTRVVIGKWDLVSSAVSRRIHSDALPLHGAGDCVPVADTHVHPIKIYRAADKGQNSPFPPVERKRLGGEQALQNHPRHHSADEISIIRDRIEGRVDQRKIRPVKSAGSVTTSASM